MCESALQALQSKDWTSPLILQLLEQHHFLSTVLVDTIHFCWIPSHVGIKGNDVADQGAKDATNDYPSFLTVPYTDRRRHRNSFVRSKWQTLWDLAVNNKLHAIQPSLGRWPWSRRNARREEVVLSIITCYLLQLLVGASRPLTGSPMWLQTFFSSFRRRKWHFRRPNAMKETL